MKKVLICFLCLLLLCGCTTQKKDTNKPTIVTTIFPLFDFARAVGGDKIEVKMLIKPGTEVHSYDPLPSDMAAVYDSDLFLYIGGDSDEWVQNLLDENDINSLKLLDCVTHHTEHHEGHSHADEHIWTSPENAIQMLEKICENIIKIDPANKDIYHKNCDEYIQKINIAAKEISDVVSQNSEPFILVADRFPFAYFTTHYGIEYEAAFDGCAVSTDISMKTMLRLTDTIEKRRINTVFVTELSSQNIANALSEELGVQILELHSAHNVSADDFESGITYVDIMHRNKLALERGLKS